MTGRLTIWVADLADFLLPGWPTNWLTDRLAG
jgi:hypothetical protein